MERTGATSVEMKADTDFQPASEHPFRLVDGGDEATVH